MLVQCLYASRPSLKITEEQVASILEQSRRNNPMLGVTGILCYSEDVFVQILEGGRDEVSSLFTSIVRDDRHRYVTILAFDEIGQRMFSNWTMGQVDMSKINPGLLLKYSEKPTLDPFSCSGHATMSVIRELLASAGIAGRSG